MGEHKPVVTLNRAVALAMVEGPRAGMELLGALDEDDRVAHTHRLEAVRAHLLELAGDLEAAREVYLPSRPSGRRAFPSAGTSRAARLSGVGNR